MAVELGTIVRGFRCGPMPIPDPELVWDDDRTAEYNEQFAAWMGCVGLPAGPRVVDTDDMGLLLSNFKALARAIIARK